MKEQFITKKFQKKTEELLEQIQEVIESYIEQGYRLTLRQLYYQLVTVNIIPNRSKEYARLSTILTDARMCGLVDWDVIEDRVRVPQKAPEWESASEIMDAVVEQFRLPRLDNQEYYVELWTEKDALTSILEPITKKYHVTLIINRGYSSASAMYRASKRFLYAEERGQYPLIFYLGDYDPSGLDMDRDIQDRLESFGVSVPVRRIGLSMEQIEQYNPPPNPAKMTDPRAKWYKEIHGDESWEVDALRPQVLDRLVRENLESVLDMEKYQEIIEEENRIKKTLQKVAANL